MATNAKTVKSDALRAAISGVKGRMDVLKETLGNQSKADAEAAAKKAVGELTAGAPEALDTFKEVSDYLETHKEAYEALKAATNDRYTKTEVNTILEGYVKTTDLVYMTETEATEMVAEVFGE